MRYEVGRNGIPVRDFWYLNEINLRPLEPFKMMQASKHQLNGAFRLFKALAALVCLSLLPVWSLAAVICAPPCAFHNTDRRQKSNRDESVSVHSNEGNNCDHSIRAGELTSRTMIKNKALCRMASQRAIVYIVATQQPPAPEIQAQASAESAFHIPTRLRTSPGMNWRSSLPKGELGFSATELRI